MRNAPFALTFLFTLCLWRITAASPWPIADRVPPEGGPGPGFTEAVFQPAALQAMLSHRDCVGIRFYNAMPSDGAQGTVMAIGIRADGSEIIDAGSPTAYLASNGVVQVMELQADSTYRPSWMIAGLPKDRSEAVAACERLTAAGFASYSASFSAAEVNALLAVRDCTGLRITPLETAGSHSMTISAVSMAEGRMNALGSGEGFEKACTDPCPTVCGPPSNYINVR